MYKCVMTNKRTKVTYMYTLSGFKTRGLSQVNSWNEVICETIIAWEMNGLAWPKHLSTGGEWKVLLKDD